MKEHAKKALKHDFEVAGKTIPTLAVAVLFLVGTGSAALLSSFGTVSGDATVTQSVTIDGEQAEGESGPTITADYSSVVGGEAVSSHHVLKNNYDGSVEVSVDSSESEPGVSGYHFLYSRNDNDRDGDYEIEASKVEAIEDGDYAIHLESEETVDYASVEYPVDLSSNDRLRYDAKVMGNHDHGSEIDEVILKEDDGTQYTVTQASDVTEGEVTVDLSDGDLYERGTPPTLTEIDTIGIAYGDSDASLDAVEGTPQPVDVTIDDVETGSDSSFTNIDEITTSDRNLISTGVYNETVEGYAFNTSVNYGLVKVSAFDVNIVPDTYTVTTSVSP